MRLSEIYSKQNNKPVISFEVFPPKDNTQEKNQLVVNELQKLVSFNPKLVSITYGAGGSTRENSLDLAKMINNSLNVSVMPHFTCIGSSKEFIASYMQEMKELGFKNVLALRGDIPNEQNAELGDFKFANELVAFINKSTDFSIGVAGYPEMHVQAESLEKDIENLKRKVDSGAEIIYTQLFFDNEYFYRYMDKIRSVGINIPVIPGILPITSYKQLDKMISLCNVKLPDALKGKLDKYAHDKNAILEMGKEHAVLQSQKLLNFGAKGLHFYILNKSNPIDFILKNVL